MTDSHFTLIPSNRFSDLQPDCLSALKIHAGSWKFDFDKLNKEEIIEVCKRDARPMFCRESFGNLGDLKILELGPSDGYNTLGLELEGANDVVSIEGNAGAFLRCVTLKNAFGMKSNFLYGDFEKYIKKLNFRYDLIYASGIMYHLVDPINFFLDCAKMTNKIFIWTFVYDDEIIRNHSYESKWFDFSDRSEQVLSSKVITLHKRYYEQSIIDSDKYAGGFSKFANWLNYEDWNDLFCIAGFKVVREVPDSYAGIPAYNFLLERI